MGLRRWWRDPWGVDDYLRKLDAARQMPPRVLLDLERLMNLPEDDRVREVEAWQEILRRCLSEPDEMRVALLRRDLDYL